MKETFSKETRLEIFRKYDFKCHVCGRKDGLEIHHIIHNTKLNRKLYGNEKVQSTENGLVLCHDHHNNYSLYDRELLKELREKWNS